MSAASSRQLKDAAEDEVEEWVAEKTDDWTHCATPFLPFLSWAQYQTLRPVGTETLSLPFSPFFSLFLAANAPAAAEFNKARGHTGYRATHWEPDPRCAGTLRTLRYEAGVASDDSQGTRRCAVVEKQRCLVYGTTLLFESRLSEEVKKAAGPRFEMVERWEVKEVRGYVKTVTQVWARSGSSSGLWKNEALRRLETWASIAQGSTYSDAVATMLSDSLFGTAAGVAKANNAKKIAPYSAPVPPSYVDTVIEVEEEQAKEQEVILPELHQETSLGSPTVPWRTDPWEVEKQKPMTASWRPKKSLEALGGSRRAEGAVFEILFKDKVGLDFAELRGTAVVDGIDGDSYGGDASPPRVGAAVVSVNGVRLAGLGLASSLVLLRQKPPLTLSFVESNADDLLDSLSGVAEKSQICSLDLERALASPKASKLREQLSEFERSFSDLEALERSEHTPSEMLVSAIEYALDFIREQGLLTPTIMSRKLDPKARRSQTVKNLLGSSPSEELDEEESVSLYWDAVRDLLERRLLSHVFDSLIRLSPEYSSGDADLRSRLSRLRFLKLEHLGIEVKDGAAPGSEWAVAQLELQRLDEARSVSEILERLTSSVRFIATAVEARCNRGKPLACYSAIGADELLPAITYTVIQANPRRLASTLWLVDKFALGSQLRQERAYAYANFSAAVHFARDSLEDASKLEGLIERSVFERGVQLSALTDKAVKAAEAGDARTLRLVLAAGANPLAQSMDRTTTTLHSSLLKRDSACVAACLSRLHELDKHSFTEEVPRQGSLRGQTALMVAAAVGDVTATLSLLELGFDAEAKDLRGRRAADVAKSNGNEECLAVLECGDPEKESLAGAAARGERQKVKGLLLRGASPDAQCPKLGCSPLVCAAAAGSTECLEALLEAHADSNKKDTQGTVPLMWSVGLSASSCPATVTSQIAVATRLLRHGALRDLADGRGRCAQEWAETQGGSSRLKALMRVDPTKVKIFDVAKQGRFDDLVALLDQGVDPNQACAEKQYTPLIAAAYNTDLKIASALLNGGLIQIDAKGRQGLTALMYAAQTKSLPMVSLLLRHGANRDVRCQRGKCALDYAMEKKQNGARSLAEMATENKLRELLSVDPSKILLVEAAARDDATKLSALLAQGALPNERRWLHSPAGWHLELTTPLIAACAYDCKKTCAALLASSSIQIDLANPLGQTPLMYAAMRGSSEVLLMLLKRGANRRLRDRHGRRALDWALRRARMDSETIKRSGTAAERIVQVSTDRADRLAVPLLRYDRRTHSIQHLAFEGVVDGVVALVKLGADVNALEKACAHGETALLACCLSKRLEVLRRLLQHPSIDVDLASSRGLTPLMQAAASGFDDGVLALLKAGAKRRAKTSQGRDAADYATEHGHVALAALLSADPSIVSIHEFAESGHLLLISGLLRQQPDLLNSRRKKDGATALLLAASNRRVKAVELLLKQAKINVDETNQRRETPLMLACGAGCLDIASRLLSAGASSNARDADGNNPTSWAAKKSYSNMMLYLGLLAVSS